MTKPVEMRSTVQKQNQNKVSMMSQELITGSATMVNREVQRYDKGKCRLANKK
jgi:hypothetical protein